MTRYLYIATLILLTSCGQKKDDTDKNEPAKLITADTTIAEEDSNDLTSVPNVRTINTLSEKLKSFIPKGYVAIDASFGDANLDGIADTILILDKSEEYDDVENAEKRKMLLLLGQSDGSYKLAIRNENVVEMLGTSDANLDSFIETKIKNGYISIDHLIARLMSSWKSTTTFKFDEAQGNWFLYEEHFTSYAYKEGANLEEDEMETVTDVVKTAKDFGVISLDKYDVYNNEITTRQ